MDGNEVRLRRPQEFCHYAALRRFLGRRLATTAPESAPNTAPSSISPSITSGALTQDNAGLISGVPKGLEPHQKLPNELGTGVCSVPEVVDWYGKDPYNTQTFTTGLCYAICDGVAWFKTAVKDFTYPVLMLHGEKDGLVSVQDTYDFFAAASSTDRQMKIYGGLYHEIFNEYCRDEVISDTLRWMRRRL